MFIFRKPFNFMTFEVADPAGGGGAAAAVAQPPGQGEPQQQNGGFWNMFPNVPEEHRPLLEPHIREMQGHVTRLEQQMAPLKPFLESGLSPDQTAGLLRFSQDFDANPQEMWIRIGSMLQEQGVVDPELDLEYLAALARGEDPPDEPVAPGAPVEPGDPTAVDESNPLFQTVQELQAKVAQMEQRTEEQELTRSQQVQDRLLERKQAEMKKTLMEAGWPEEALTDARLASEIIAHRGDFAAATKSLLDTRSGLLKGFVQTTTDPGQQDLDLPNGVPSAPKGVRPREKNDPWAKARSGAESALRRTNASAAQE